MLQFIGSLPAPRRQDWDLGYALVRAEAHIDLAQFLPPEIHCIKTPGFQTPACPSGCRPHSYLVEPLMDSELTLLQFLLPSIQSLERGLLHIKKAWVSASHSLLGFRLSEYSMLCGPAAPGDFQFVTYSHTQSLVSV